LSSIWQSEWRRLPFTVSRRIQDAKSSFLGIPWPFLALYSVFTNFIGNVQRQTFNVHFRLENSIVSYCLHDRTKTKTPRHTYSSRVADRHKLRFRARFHVFPFRMESLIARLADSRSVLALTRATLFFRLLAFDGVYPASPIVKRVHLWQLGIVTYFFHFRQV
jgi:hypothetical protein